MIVRWKRLQVCWFQLFLQKKIVVCNRTYEIYKHKIEKIQIRIKLQIEYKNVKFPTKKDILTLIQV